MRPRDLNTPWASLFVRRLAAAGVRRAVVSPGSRSTPLALAAAREPAIETTVVVDERSAAFFALGAAKATGAPVLLVCTSGTAAAHYLPAIVEASLAGAPLIAVTADRPPELQRRAAPQTIDQTNLFGRFVRLALDLGLPDEAPRALEGLAASAALAADAALHPEPGPVHVNAPFRKPLEPQAARNEADASLAAAAATIASRPAPRRVPAERRPSPAAAAALARRAAGRRGLIVCGPGPLPHAAARGALARLAHAAGFPVLAEATSQFRFDGGATRAAGSGDCGRGEEERREAERGGAGRAPRVDLFDPLLRAARLDALRPEFVLEIGAPPTSKGYASLLEREPELERWVIGARGWSDPSNSVAGFIDGDLAPTLDLLAAAFAEDEPADEAWGEAWSAADGASRAALDEILAGDAAAGPRLLRRLLATRPAGSLLFLGNSLSVREVDLFCPGDAAPPLDVLAQKGANGIDGLVSGAAGAAAAAARPTTLLCGDVSLLHDCGGLAVAAAAGGRLDVAFADNGGGRLFDLLPIAEPEARPAEFERLFLTPPRVDFDALAAAFGVPRLLAAAPEDLDAAPATVGARLVRMIEPGGNAAPLHRRFAALVAERAAAALRGA